MLAILTKAARLAAATALCLAAIVVPSPNAAHATNGVSCYHLGELRPDVVVIYSEQPRFHCYANAGFMSIEIQRVKAVRPGNNDIIIYSNSFPFGAEISRWSDWDYRPWGTVRTVSIKAV
ncbi:MAG TPA: beta/gamma crystallin domain-containing protein [Catenuloplanes sp.]|jgi:hypothetical protein